MVSVSPVTPAAGISCVSVPAARARATAPAFSSPLTRNHTARLRLRAAKVSDTRSGGGFGESVTPTATRSSTSSWGEPGKSEATCPSGPTPSISTSNEPAPCSRRVREYAAAASSTDEASAVDGISCTLAASKASRSSNAARA